MAAPTPLPLVPSIDPEAATPEVLAWWAGGLLNAVVAADTSEDGEPILAAAGHAATAALLLLQHRAADVGDPVRSRVHLREAYAVSADQLAILRELLHERPPAAPRPAPNAPRAGDRHRPRRRRLRLIRGGR
jgi:hypothetical protein